MGITLNIPMPINCVDCDNRAIRPLIGCKLIFQGCANCGRHPNCPIIEAIPKADYENRLKADMEAMLEDLDLQIDESAAYNLEVAKVQRLIRDKIDKLKEKSDDIQK